LVATVQWHSLTPFTWMCKLQPCGPTNSKLWNRNLQSLHDGEITLTWFYFAGFCTFTGQQILESAQYEVPIHVSKFTHSVEWVQIEQLNLFSLRTIIQFLQLLSLHLMYAGWVS
jgi:hypothetical protein